ncbi:MAG: hypothetical protein OEZ30_00945 [Candidatus Aminicenantes bacterium]|nr:hypothetical protein [Candidatus Aminicenantes bacterium]MDH5714114.1 hypothetical protein [Candidatus Aminicenantes bacterium]
MAHRSRCVRRHDSQTDRDDSGKNYTYGTLDGLLRQLDFKGFVRKRLGDPTPKKGGRRKTYFDLTPECKQSLKEAIQFHHHRPPGPPQHQGYR